MADHHNQPFQSSPIPTADANLTRGSDPILGSDPKPGSGSDPLLGSGDFIAAEIGGGSSTTPVEKSSEAKHSKRGAEDGESMDWLPTGWTVITKTRTTGVTAGTTDKYYVDPTTGQRFRSKAEIKRFLETGSKNKSLSGANATPSETTGKRKSGTKKTSTKKKKEAEWSFDFENPPEEITWTLEDNTWKPSIGGESVPELTAQEWAATFERVPKMD